MVKNHTNINVSGLTIQDIMNMDYDIINKMNISDLRRVSSRLVSASNKRIRRLEKNEIGRLSPAYVSIEKRGGQFSNVGKNINQLRSQFIEMKQFLEKKTSTIKGWTAHRKYVEENYGGTLTKAQAKKFWTTYRQVENNPELYGVVKNLLGSKSVQKELNKIITTKKYSGGNEEQRNALINAKITEMYNEVIEKQRRQTFDMMNYSEVEDDADSGGNL